MSTPALRVVPAAPQDRHDDLLDEWELFALAAGWAQSTIGMRRHAAQQMRKRTGASLLDVSSLQLAKWLAGYSTPATRSTYYAGVNAVLTWMHKMGHRADNPLAAIPRPKEKRGAPRPVTRRQLDDVLDSDLWARPRAYVLLGAYAGLRVHEIAKVRGDDVDTDAMTLRVRGKGGVDAVLPLHPLIATISRGYPDRGWWFPSPAGGGNHVHARAVSETIKAAFDRAGHPGVVAHQLRHWYGTNLLRASGGNLRVAQTGLRHASPATTAIYTLVEDVEVREAVNRLR